MPKVSIVLSTYNRPEMLARAIKSCVSQTYQDWELLVVHDGDNRQLDACWDDPRVTHIKLPENFGCDTRPKNVGIKKAKGEYVALLDDDNTWRPNHLAVLVKEIESDPNLDLVYGDRWVTDEEGWIPSGVGVYSDFDFNVLMDHNYIDTSDVLVKRDALVYVGGFDERIKKLVDWILWVRLAKAGKRFKRVPVVITDYYIHANQKSQTITDMTPTFDPIDCDIRLPYLGPIPEPRVAIFSITYDRLEYTRRCFDSLARTAHYPFDHFIVDNGSTDGTPEWLDWNKRGTDIYQAYGPKDQKPGAHNTSSRAIIPILNKENKGFSVASNQALDAISAAEKPYDIIVKVDNDAFFITEGWLAKMVEIWKTNHRIALSYFVQGLKDNPGDAPRIGRGFIKGELVGFIPHLGGICHFVDASAYKEFRWDEQSFLHGFQDLELSQYLGFNGYLMGYLENDFLSHGPLGTDAQKTDCPDRFHRRVTVKETRYEEAPEP